MSLWDFQHPDIVYGCDTKVVYIRREIDDTTTVVIETARGLFLPLRVFARRDNWSHIFNRTYDAWVCTRTKPNGFECRYAPGHEDMPPLPGQKCYNCGGIRAMRIPIVEDVRVEAYNREIPE